MTIQHIAAAPALALALALVAPTDAAAHCDSLDGPVVKAAQKALDTGDPAHVLIWVQAPDEPELRAAFDKSRQVRATGPLARDLADQFFFETVVRLHRAGEGAPYTGLKPAGRDLGPAIPAADKALADGSPNPVMTLLAGALEHGMHEHFARAKKTASFSPGDLAAGRVHVKAYVEYVHYVERVFEALTTSPHGHFTETAEGHR